MKKENQKIINNNKQYLPLGNKNNSSIKFLDYPNNNDISGVNMIHEAKKKFLEMRIMMNLQNLVILQSKIVNIF